MSASSFQIIGNKRNSVIISLGRPILKGRIYVWYMFISSFLIMVFILKINFKLKLGMNYTISIISRYVYVQCTEKWYTIEEPSSF